MKIVTITRDHLSDHMGGTRIYAHDINRLLAGRGHNVVHLCYDCLLDEQKTIDSVAVIKRGKVKAGMFTSLVNRLTGTRNWIGKWYKQLQPDVIFVHSAEVFQYLIGRDIPKAKIVYFVHAIHSHEIVFDFYQTLKSDKVLSGKLLLLVRTLIYTPIIYLLEALSFRYSSLRITMSQYDRSEVARFHGKKIAENICLIPIGIDVCHYVPAKNKKALRKNIGLPESKQIFIVFRRLAPRMGLENLIEAFNNFSRKKDSLLLIGGKGALNVELQQMIARYGLDEECKLLGFVSEEQKLNYLQSADFFVLPTEELEGFGIVILEALACNLPVIGTPVGGIPETLSKLGPEFLTRGIAPEDICERLEWAYDYSDAGAYSSEFRDLVTNEYNWQELIVEIEKVVMQTAGYP